MIKRFLVKKTKGRKKGINLLFDPETEYSKHIVSHYMPNMKEAKNIYTDAHRHTQAKSYYREKRDT